MRKKYLGLVDVVVSTGIGASDGHDDKIAALDEVVVDGGLELVLVLLDPFAKVDGKCNHFCCLLFGGGGRGCLSL
jgi:hypothetical protein